MHPLLIALLIFIPILLIVSEFASIVVHGWLIKSIDINDALTVHMAEGSSLNPYDNNIINIGKMPFVSTIPIPVISKYYVDGVGRVLIFSRAHYRIKTLHKRLKRIEKKHKVIITNRQKLKIA